MFLTDSLSLRLVQSSRWFLVLAALSVLPFLLSAGYSLVQISQSKQDDTAKQFVIKASSTAQVLRERLAASVAALNAIASSDAALNDDLPALYLLAQRVMQRMPENSAIALISPNGRVLFSTLQPFGSPTFPSRVPADWKRVFDTGGPTVSEPFVNPINKRPAAAIGIPIFQQEKVAYCLSMVFLTSSINDLLMAQQLPEQWPVEVISESGNLLAHSRASDTNIGKPVSDEIIAAKRAQVKGAFNTHASNGTLEKTILVQVGNFDWMVAMSVPKSKLNEPVRNVILLLFVFGCAFAILGGLAVTLPAHMLHEVPVTGRSQALKGAALPALPRAHLGPSLIALAASILLGGYTAWLTQINLQRIAASVEKLEHIHAEQRQTEQMVHLVKALETGLRGFAATGNGIFLESVVAASQEMPALTERIKAGFSKADLQDFNWTDFDSLSKEYLQFATQVVALHRKSGALDVQDGYLIAYGKLVMAKLRLQIDEMNNRLDKRIRLVDSSIESQREQASQQQWLSSFAVSALLLISVAIWLYERQRRLQIHAQLEASNVFLEERVAQRTHDLATANRRVLLYAQEAQALIDAERKRLSREVHDQVGQIFTAIKLIAGSFKNGSLDSAQQATLLNAVESGIKISRRIAAELRPPLLDDFGLRPALEHYLKSVCEPAGLSYELHFPEECGLANPQVSELFRMVQEACINVTRHAKAMHLEVVGRITGPYLDVCIDDDGMGYDEALVREGALGILGMRERAHLIEAQVHLGASPMGGTRVHIKIPLAEPEQKERV